MRINKTQNKNKTKKFTFTPELITKNFQIFQLTKKKKKQISGYFLINYILLFVRNVMCINSGFFSVCLIICYCYY